MTALQWPYWLVTADGPYRADNRTEAEMLLLREGYEVMSLDWDALASAVRARRERLGYRQADVAKRGGLSIATVRDIEQRKRTNFSERSFTEMEHALKLREGTLEKVLANVVVEDDLNEIVEYKTVEDHAVGTDVVSVSAVPDRAGSSPPPEWTDKLVGAAMTRHLEAEQKRSRRLLEMYSGPERQRAEQLAKSFTASQAAVQESARRLLAAQTVLSNLPDVNPPAVSAFPTVFAGTSTVPSYITKWLAASMPKPLDLTAILGPNFADRLAPNVSSVIATPLFSQKLIEDMEKLEELEEELLRQPWFDPDAPFRAQVARLRHEQQHGPIDENDSLDLDVDRLDVPDDDAALRLVESEPEVLEAEIVEGPWSVVLTAQQELGDVDTLSLASELFDRVRRSRPSLARDEQMQVLNDMVGELLHSQKQGQRGRLESGRRRTSRE